MILKNDEERELWKAAYVGALQGLNNAKITYPSDAAQYAGGVAGYAVIEYRKVRGDR